MIDDGILADALEASANGRTAAKRRKQVQPLRGIRGVPDSEIARLLAGAWEASGIDLDDDHGALVRLFQAAFEDGLVAIGLTAAGLPDAPQAAWDLGLRWLDRIDDTITADALGWLVLGPAVLATRRRPRDLLGAATAAGHPSARRAAAAAGLAWTTETVQGAAAAALRARVGQTRIRFVEEAASPFLTALADGLVRDEDPAVRKGLRRVLRAWAGDDPAAVAAWADGVRGGLPRLLHTEVERARRRAARAP